MTTTKSKQLLPHLRQTRRLVLTPGDIVPAPVTKLGGVPWWPSGRPRPRCERGHDMAFHAQVRLSDVPGLPKDGGLLSFHYCLECAYAGGMSFGRGDDRNRGYAVTLFEDPAVVSEELGMVVEGSLPAATVGFSDVEEAPSLEDAWTLDLELPPELYAEGDGDMDENIGLGLVHVPRSKVGGWPSWVQDPEWPTCRDGRRMTFVMQIDWELGEASPWGGGGYAYLFVCGSECRDREADLVVQTS